MTKKERKLRKARALERITQNQVDTVLRQIPGTILQCEATGQRCDLSIKVVTRLEDGQCNQYWFADFNPANGYFAQEGVNFGVADPTAKAA